MRGNVVLAHVQNLTNHRGDDMCGHFEHGPLTMFNYVKQHFIMVLEEAREEARRATCTVNICEQSPMAMPNHTWVQSQSAGAFTKYIYSQSQTVTQTCISSKAIESALKSGVLHTCMYIKHLHMQECK